MTKKTTNSSKDTSSPRSVLGTILAVIILLVAVIAAGITGVDVNTILETLGQPTLIPVTEPAPPTATTGSATLTPTVAVPTEVASNPNTVVEIPVQQGFGAAKGIWQVFFTAPTGSRDTATYVGGVDVPLAAAIGRARRTLDIAAFEFNNPVLTRAVLDAHSRGVRVRMVTDNEHGLHDDNSTISQLLAVGIPVVDDNRSGLMHNKFMIIDSTEVWTGSTNFTINDVYRNNNNLIMIRAARMVDSYQSEFNEMFEQKSFGIRSPRGNSVTFTEGGITIETLFAAEDDVIGRVLEHVGAARTSIRFMAFSFTEVSLGRAMVERAANGVNVRGIFERVGSETNFSEMTRLFCAGLPVRQDGNSFILHHKVIIIDSRIVLTGSFNFSQNAIRSNDENMVIIDDRDLARMYLAEFERRWAEASAPNPDRLDCAAVP